MKKKKVLSFIGTRPEAIKMAPVIECLSSQNMIDSQVVSVGQHREMLDQMLTIFDIHPKFDLDIMRENQTLPGLTAILPIPLDRVLAEVKPDLVLTQGDTTTAFMVSLASFYRKIPIGHIEAGLRAGRVDEPFPEEMNRLLISRLATLHFAPTERSKQSLLDEGIEEDKIFLTGNTVVDSIYSMMQQVPPLPSVDPNKRLILVTAHRRENIGQRLVEICQAVQQIVDKNEDVQVLFPVHCNPAISKTVEQIFASHPRIVLTKPLEYNQFVAAMKQAYLILSDSGGVQEEASVVGTPMLVLRDQTERQEGIRTGVAKLVGTNRNHIIETVQRLLDDQKEYRSMIQEGSPYGDGQSRFRIVQAILSFLA